MKDEAGEQARGMSTAQGTATSMDRDQEAPGPAAADDLPWGGRGPIVAGPASTENSKPDNRRGPRVIVVGASAFRWLKALQGRAPAPRVDMRYLLEGTVAVLQARPDVRQSWLQRSLDAMYQHLAVRRQQEAMGDTGRGMTATGSRQGRSAAASDEGTGRNAAFEGAAARTQGTPYTTGHREMRNEDCKALQIGEARFQWLKGVQGTTRDPRIELRYLVEGALALLQQEDGLLPGVVENARHALAEHLALLQTEPVCPFHMEQQQ
jgi:hypothetical protein